MRHLVPLLLIAACSPSSATKAPPPPLERASPAAAPAAPRAPSEPLPASRPNFELDCAASDTTNAALLQCVRTDTRDGDVRLINYMFLPVTKGATAVSPGPPGRFTTACAAPSTGARADFYCIRLDTQTGDLVLVNLTQVPAIPAMSTAQRGPAR